MINGVTREFGEVLFDGARVPAANMIGRPGEGWAVAMTVLSHEREPQEIGNASRYTKTAQAARPTLVRRRARTRSPTSSAASSPGRSSRPTCCSTSSAAASRIGSTASSTDREGSIDKLLNTWVEQAVGHAAVDIAGCAHDGGDPTMLNTYLYSRAQSVMGGTSQIQKNLIASRILGLPSS